jgi:hypothetical protein
MRDSSMLQVGVIPFEHPLLQLLWYSNLANESCDIVSIDVHCCDILLELLQR